MVAITGFLGHLTRSVKLNTGQGPKSYLWHPVMTGEAITGYRKKAMVQLYRSGPTALECNNPDVVD